VKPVDDDEETRERRPSGSGSGSRLRVVLKCTCCKDALGQREAVYCALCLAPHHHDCQRAHGRCAAMGCACTVTIRPRSASARQRALQPRIPPAPRASLVTLPAFLGILLGVAGLAASATAVAFSVRTARQQVVIRQVGPSGDSRIEPSWSGARVRLEANGVVQTVDLAPGEWLSIGPEGDGTHAVIVRTGVRRDVVLAVVPPGPVRVGLDHEPREDEAVVRADESATFELDEVAHGRRLLRLASDDPHPPLPRSGSR
jgi:hypothetical protein